MTTLTVERTREVGFDAAPHQKANWGKGWSEFCYVSEGKDPPSAERQYAILGEIVSAASSKGGTARYFLAVGDAVKRVEEATRGRGGRHLAAVSGGRPRNSIAVIGATDDDYNVADYR